MIAYMRKGIFKKTLNGDQAYIAAQKQSLQAQGFVEVDTEISSFINQYSGGETNHVHLNLDALNHVSGINTGDSESVTEHESNYNHNLLHSDSLDHDPATQNSAIASKATLSEVKADSEIADALDKKHDENHNHDTVYEAKNSNIQTHVASSHAPSDAQKNSDITKAEIEAKLTGEITSHSHVGGGSSTIIWLGDI